MHIEATLLANGTHELLPKLVNEQPEVQINLMEDNEDLNMTLKSDSELHEVQANIVKLTEVPNPDSEESKSTDSIDSTKGKPRCIILLF